MKNIVCFANGIDVYKLSLLFWNQKPPGFYIPKQGGTNMKENATVLHVKDIPLTESGEPDIAAILAANELGHIDLSKATVVTQA